MRGPLKYRIRSSSKRKTIKVDHKENPDHRKHKWIKKRKNYWECQWCPCKKYVLNRKHIYTLRDQAFMISPECKNRTI